jgi:hypothetical protein
MGVLDWDWKLAVAPQSYPWDCSAASLAWCLRTIGHTLTESDVISGLGPGRISPTLGLLDASGAGLVSYCYELGIDADNNPDAHWADVIAAAGFQPMLIGGRRWYHWTAVRMGSIAANNPDINIVALMNPADGYMGVSQTLTPAQFEQLGPFSAVWFRSW